MRAMYSRGNVTLQVRHRPSGLNSRFAAQGSSFPEYIDQTQAMLRHVHAGKAEAEHIVFGNAPFELLPEVVTGRRRGIVLTHGLSDSPYHMRYLARFFQRQGFRVMVPLLPGHGTQPGDLLEVRWQDWAETVAWAAACMAQQVDELYLGGFSAGAALSVRHAALDARVRGLFLFSPALAVSGLARWAGLLHRGRRLWPRMGWLHVLQDRDLYKYESFCMNAAAQMHALTHALPARAPDIPVFAAASADDATVQAQATWDFMQATSTASRHLVWYALHEVAAPGVEWVCGALPERHIRSSAHTAVVVAPEDAHYGQAGSYANCLHYAADAACFERCMAADAPVWQGETLPAYLAHGMMRRLMYNPHYAALEASLAHFLEGL